MITLRAAVAPVLSAAPRGPGLDTIIPGAVRAAGQPYLTTGRDAAWLRLWTTMLGLAVLTGRPLPSPPPRVRAAAVCQPRRTGRVIASLSERLAAQRAAALRGCYPPAALARALAGVGKRLLAGQPVSARAGQVWVIPQLRWAHQAAGVGWERDGARPDDLAPPLDFALAGLHDWPGILAGQRLALLLRHPAALTAPANRALAATALFGADGKAAFGGALAADLTLAFPAPAHSGGPRVVRQASPGGRPGSAGAGWPGKNSRENTTSRTDNAVSPAHHPDPAILAEATRLMDCPAEWLIAFLR